MATTPQPPEQLDVDTSSEIEREVAQLEDHSFTEASDTGVRGDLPPFWRGLIFLLALTLAVFHIYTSAVFGGSLPGLQQGAFHLGFALCLVFLLYPGKAQRSPRQRYYGLVLVVVGLALLAFLGATGAANWEILAPAVTVLLLVQIARRFPLLRFAGMPVGDLLLAVGGVFCGLYLFLNYEDINRLGARVNQEELYVLVGTLGIILVLVAAQRTLGAALVVLAGAMLAYAYLGQNFPGFLEHSGYPVDRIVANSFLGTEAVFGTPIWISATVIFLFLIFAAMLQRTGMERFFTDFALGSVGWATGGTGKVSVATSAFTGTITGSSVANTVSNGAFTIPMMKKSGYSKEYSGGVEAASSTGGQLAPPIMGAAAFIMIEFTGVPYIEIIQAAILPAILFYVGQFVVIHYDSKKLGIWGIPKRILPSVRGLVAIKGFLLVPIVAIFILLSLGFSPGYAAMGAIGIAVGTNLLNQLLRPLVALAPAGPAAAAEDGESQWSAPRLLNATKVGAKQPVGLLLLLVSACVLAAVGWLAFLALGQLAPVLGAGVRVSIVGLALSLVVLTALTRLVRLSTLFTGTEVRDRVLGVLLVLYAMVALAVLGWLVFLALGQLAPNLGTDLRVVLVGVGLSAAVALLAHVVMRLRGSEEQPAGFPTSLGRMSRVLWPLVVAAAAVFLLHWAVDWVGETLALELARGEQILIVSVGTAVLTVAVGALFRSWVSTGDDQLSLHSLLDGLVSTARIALPIIMACGAAGLIAGVITLTGLGLGLAGGLVTLAQGYLIPVLVLSMLACLILGIGLPTTANYVITATLAAPAILAILAADLDQPTTAMLLMAHMFVYYYGIMADITPPVCLAAYAASGISGGRPIATGVQAVRFALSGFLVPFMFVLNPELLLQEITWAQGIHAVTTAVAGAGVLGIAAVGYINRRIDWFQRILLIVAALALLDYGWELDLVGVAIVAAIYLNQWRLQRQDERSGVVTVPQGTQQS